MKQVFLPPSSSSAPPLLPDSAFQSVQPQRSDERTPRYRPLLHLHLLSYTSSRCWLCIHGCPRLSTQKHDDFVPPSPLLDVSVHLSPGLTPLVAANKSGLKCTVHCVVYSLVKTGRSVTPGSAVEWHMINVEESKCVDSCWQMAVERYQRPPVTWPWLSSVTTVPPPVFITWFFDHSTCHSDCKEYSNHSGCVVLQGIIATSSLVWYTGNLLHNKVKFKSTCSVFGKNAHYTSFSLVILQKVIFLYQFLPVCCLQWQQSLLSYSIKEKSTFKKSSQSKCD